MVSTNLKEEEPTQVVAGLMTQGSSNLASDPTIRRNLDIMDSLHKHIGKTEKIGLLRIVVIGDQSSGKSSTLESIVGVDLPKGTNIVTRNPLLIRMIRLPDNSEESEYATITDEERSDPPERIDDLANVPDFIRKYTNKLSGEKTNVTKKEITLTIHRKNIYDLTLIDLPGITRVPTVDQDPDVCETIKNMIISYITPPESIILNVCPSQSDFATCETLNLSRLVDPNGERTFGVCTKIDESLARKDTCAKILASRDTDILLKLGWIAVRNRSQDEVDNSLSFEDARAREQALFTTHPTLSELPSTHWGIPELITRLARLQNERIRILLPAISAQVRQRLTEKKKLLASLAERVSSPHEAYLKFEGYVSELNDNIAPYLSATADDETPSIHSELQTLCKQFQDSVMRSSSPFLTKEYGARVDKALDKVQGISLPNILFPTVIESLVSLEIKKLESITWDLLEKCHHLFEQTLLAEVNHVAPPDNSALSHLLKTIVQDKLEMQRRGAEAAIKECLQNENDAYTLNGCYQDTLGKIQQTVVQQGETADLNSPHVVSDGFSVNDLTGITFEVVEPNVFRNPVEQIRDLQIMMFTYWNIVYKRHVDNVCLTVRRYFLEFVKKHLRAGLIRIVSKDYDFLSLFKESSMEEQKRASLEHSIANLELAKKQLAGI